MKFREVAGLRLSTVGLGTWQFGSREWRYGPVYASGIAPEVVASSLDRGVNLFDTPLLAMLPEAQRTALGESVLFPKVLGVPAQYGQLVVSIVENRYLNAEVIRLDGGIRMPPK